MSNTAKWELRDRTYYLKGGRAPLTYKIKSTGLLHFDEETGTNREIRYATNQKSIFVDEQDKNVRVEHIVFEDGVLFVPRNKPLLQQFLELYHPDKKWGVVDKVAEARDEVEWIEVQLEALTYAKELDVDRLEAIMRAEVGSAVKAMTTKELRRDAYILAQNNPELFLNLIEDEDIELRNVANLAVEEGVVKLTDDMTVFKWAQNGRKIITVPFDTEPYAALAQFFKTDDGVQVYKSIKTKLEK